MYLWISVSLTLLAVLSASGLVVRELVLAEGRTGKPRLRIGTRGRVVTLVAFLVLVIVAQFVVFLSTSQAAQRDCARAPVVEGEVIAAAPSHV